MSYKTYESYKDSNVFWVGCIPTDWYVNSVKHHFFNNKQIVGCLVDKYERLALTLNGVIKRSKEDADGLQPEKFETYQIVRKNSLIFKLIDLENIKTSRIGLSPYEGIVSPAYIVLNCKNNISFHFAEYYFLNMWYENIFNKLGSAGVRSNLNKEELLNIPFIYPSLKEQEKIANYLDKKTSEIDKNIAKNKELISLLEEKKTALINQVVTKGLDPNVPMKDSGIEWIGEIPEHWGIFKLKHICDTFGRIGFRGYTSSDLVSEGEGAYTIGGKHIQNNKLDLSDPEYLSWEKYYESPEIMVELNDLIITQRGTLGKTAFIDEQIGPATINPSMILLKNVSCNPKFLYYFLCSSFIINNINLLNTQTAVPMISQEQANNFIVLLPDVNEQNDISEYLDKKIESIEKTIEKVQENIDLLDEYKTSLIHHVVTGKIDVRDEV